ncbi:hypothetical protein BV898_07382 [Hypsibius exemplaris]|uniref:Uncharacterized protein n=1 Tax=Hypsibius exemplaris TaxID=2072580 RepID=A0A1W0WTN3_HYPEX|nr:hypothetical protein BV898_07382 [Hypsibius exemplaris]
MLFFFFTKTHWIIEFGFWRNLWEMWTLTFLTFLLTIGALNAQLIPGNINGGFSGILSQAASPNTSLPLQVDVHLIYLNNPQGIIWSGKKCDFFAWGCDIKGWGYIDLEKPYADWPGQRDMAEKDYFWYQGENSSPWFNKMFTVTICNPKTFTAGNLRVHLMDIDGGLRGADDFINNFNCIFTKPSSVSATTPETAKWSDEMSCDAQYAQPQMGMYFKYRVSRQSSFTGCPAPKK